MIWFWFSSLVMVSSAVESSTRRVRDGFLVSAAAATRRFPVDATRRRVRFLEDEDAAAAATAALVLRRKCLGIDVVTGSWP